MARSNAPPALAELRNPSTPVATLDALRRLKNDIVGHEQRKDAVIRHGIVAPLARILGEGAAERKGPLGWRGDALGSTGRETNGSSSRGADTERERKRAADAWTQSDEIRLQATLIVGSLALGMFLFYVLEEEGVAEN